MASTRNSPPADSAQLADATHGIAAMTAALAATLAAHASHASRIAVALSGGRDSMVLLDAAALWSAEAGTTMSAIHIHHGLSPSADDWAHFCAKACVERDVLLTVRRVHVKACARASLEASARRARYAALREAAIEAGIDTVLLAHHQDDQAETLLLQLARGAGPHGLASMPVARHDGRLVWLRPFLGMTRATIEAYAHARGLEWVDDESNANMRFRRNAWRHRIIPLMAAVAPGYPATVARAAEHQADAAHLLDELALVDAAADCDGRSLARSTLQALSQSRARNLLRWFLRQRGLPPPSTARLAAMLDQLLHARADARVRIVHAGAEVGVHRDRITIHAPPPRPFALAWSGEASVVLPHGTLTFVAVRGAGIDAARLRAGAVVIRSRRGGERLRVAPDRPRQRLKSLLQDAGVAPWERAALPLVYCGGELAAVAGIGVDDAFRAPPDADGLELLWRPK